MSRQLVVLMLILTPCPLIAADKHAAKLRSPVGTILERGGETGWLAPMLYDGVAADKQLLALPGARGILDIADGDVRLVLAGSLPDYSRTPVLESAVTLHSPASGFDVDFTLDRGRVIIENHKEKGPLKARARIQGKNLDFILMDNKTVVALELNSVWPAGALFSKAPKADQKPIGELILLVAKGKAALATSTAKAPIAAPALYHFDSRRGAVGPLPLKGAPNWINPSEQQPLRIQRSQAAVETLRRAIADQGALAAIRKGQASKEIDARIMATYAGVALGDPQCGIVALEDAKAKDVRTAGTAALRHYIGRGSTQDVKVYETLVADKLKPGQAGIVMELLHGMSLEARQRPETYDVLISYLQSDQLPIRQLAAATLVDIVPAGAPIPYDAAASSAQRAAAQAEWRKLIPRGQVPKTAE